MQVVALALSVLDVTTIVVFAVATIAITTAVKNASLGSVEDQLSLAHYSVLVRNLPAWVTEVLLRDHFSRLYDLSDDDWQGWCKCSRRPTLFPDPFDGQGHPKITCRGGSNRSIPVRSGRHNRKHGYKNKWVADV